MIHRSVGSRWHVFGLVSAVTAVVLLPYAFIPDTAAIDPVGTIAPSSTAFVTPYLPSPLSTTPAARADVQHQITEPPTFDPVAYVNGLEYHAGNPESAMKAYRVIAAYYGWTDTQIDNRATFVQRVMASESSFCWNARRWTYFETGKACTEHRTGRHDDVGFGQITAVLRPLTCEKANICSTVDTVASPWNSMLAYVVVLDELGKRPWCYNRNMHIRNGDCATWPG